MARSSGGAAANASPVLIPAQLAARAIVIIADVKGSTALFTHIMTTVLQILIGANKMQDAQEVVKWIEEDRIMADERLADLIYTVEQRQ
eukprot:gene29820-37190_t